MGCVVHVGAEAARQFWSLDASLRAEMIEQVEMLAEDPAAHLSRSMLPFYPGVRAVSYQSEVVEGLKMSLLVDGFDDEPVRLVLVAITHTMSDKDE